MMPFADSDRVPPRMSLPSRVALALAHAIVDSNTKSQVLPFSSTVKDQVVASHDYVQDLINECQAVWTELINHPFPPALAMGTAALNGFRHYMIQDASYLEYYYRVRMEAVSRTGSFEEIKEFAAELSTSLQYVVDARSDCTNKLGVPADDVAQEPQSQALKNSIDLYESVVKNGDWLDIHIVLLPCILGYSVIANGLVSDPETVRNTLYFPLWVQANAGGSSAEKYKAFINSNIGALSEEERTTRWQGWVDNFTTACGTEKDFFSLGSSAMWPAYNIVSDGTYKIRSYLTGNPYLVPDGSSVITQTSDPGDDGKWNLANSADGYIIQNGSNFLGASIGGQVQPVYEASVSDQMQPWSINPAGVSDNAGRELYQLFVPDRLQWVLDDGGILKVFVANNSKISSQLWLFEAA